MLSTPNAVPEHAFGTHVFVWNRMASPERERRISRSRRNFVMRVQGDPRLLQIWTDQMSQRRFRARIAWSLRLSVDSVWRPNRSMSKFARTTSWTKQWGSQTTVRKLPRRALDAPDVKQCTARRPRVSHCVSPWRRSSKESKMTLSFYLF